MYNSIAEIYSSLFPSDPERSRFILKNSKADKVPRILDIGCASGDLAYELAAEGCFVTGIDLNKKMIDIAENRRKNNDNPRFLVRSMNDLGDLGPFETAVCFGNTLPHLKDYGPVQKFFFDLYDRIVRGGLFIFQIINFDILKDREIFMFPTVDIGSAVFERKYFRKEGGKLDFSISLTEKSSGTTETENIELLPLYRAKLKEMLLTAGFSDMRIYSNYEGTAADGTEFSSIYLTYKK